MKMLVRCFGLTIIGIVMIIVFLNFNMIDTRETEMIYATNNAMSQTQLIMQEIIADKTYGTDNARKEADGTDLIESNDDYKNLFMKYFEAQINSSSVYDIRFNAVDYEKGLLDVDVYCTFKPIFYKGTECLYTGVEGMEGCKTVTTHRTSIIDVAMPD